MLLILSTYVLEKGFFCGYGVGHFFLWDFFALSCGWLCMMGFSMYCSYATYVFSGFFVEHLGCEWSRFLNQISLIAVRKEKITLYKSLVII